MLPKQINNLGIKGGALNASGGGSRSDLWCQIKANVFGRDLRRLQVLHSGVLGAARGTLLWAVGSVLVFAVAFIWGAPWRQREVIRVLRTIQRAALGVALVGCGWAHVANSPEKFPCAVAAKLGICLVADAIGNSRSGIVDCRGIQ